MVYLDAVVAAAAAHGIRLIVALSVFISSDNKNITLILFIRTNNW